MIMITRTITFAIPTRQKLPSARTRDVKVLLKFSEREREREREREKERERERDDASIR